MQRITSARRTERWLDRGIAVVGLVLAALMFPLRFFVSHIYASTLPVVLGVACLLYLLADRSEPRRIRGVALPTVSKWIARGLPSLVFLLLSGMVVIATLTGRRTVPFYTLASVAAVLVLGQILFAPDEELHPRLLLAETLALTGVVQFAALGTVPGFIGIDVWTHIGFTRRIVAADSLGVIQGNKYYAAPLYHLYLAAGSLLAEASLRPTLYLTLGTFMWLAPVFVYTAASTFVQSRWAVFAAAVFAISDEAIKWTLHLIPTSLAAAFYLVAFFLLIRVLRGKTERDSLLLTLFLVVITLTHQVAAFIALVLLLAAVAAQFVLYADFPFSETGPTSLVSIVLFDAGLVTFVWSITPLHGDTFITRMLQTLQETVRTTFGFGEIANPTQGATATQLPDAVARTSTLETVVSYVNNLGFLLVLAAAIVGFLYVLRRRTATHASLTLVASASAMAVFALGLPLFGVSTFLPGRWYVFMYVPLAIGAAIGFAYLAKNLPARATAAVFLAFVLLTPAAMLVSGDATYDNPPFESENPRYSYTEEELAAMHTLGTNLGPDRPVYTDYPYTQLFERGPHNRNAAAAILATDGSPPPHDDVVYRTYQTNGAPYFAGQNRDFTYVNSYPRSRICPGDRSVLYTTQSVSFCSGDSA